MLGAQGEPRQRLHSSAMQCLRTCEAKEGARRLQGSRSANELSLPNSLFAATLPSFTKALITSFTKVQTALSKVDVELSSAFHKSHQERL